MKKTLAIFAAIAAVSFVSTPARAADPLVKYCYSLGELAGAMMGARQAGAPESEMIQMASRAHPTIRAQSISLVSSVIKTPIYATTAEKGAVVAIFRERAAISCVRQLR